MPGIWETDIQNIKGVGARRVLLLKKMGISTAGELLYFFPRDYDDRRMVRPAASYGSGQTATIKGVVVRGEDKRPRRGLTISRIYIDDGGGGLVAVWFNQPFIRRRLPAGTPLIITGKVFRFNNEVQVHVSDYEVEGRNGPVNTGRIVPVYPLTEGLSQRRLRAMTMDALERLADKVPEFIPGDILDRYTLPGVGQALRAIHYPDSPEDLRMARRRLIFEELFLHQVIISLARKKAKDKPKPHSYPAGGVLEKKYAGMLPFKMTPGQESAWREISADMQSPYPMNRLLQGDVGSGKTLVCALAMLRAAGGGLQSALMAPTEILAGQHFLNLREYFDRLGVPVVLLTGNMKKSERTYALDKIKSGGALAVVGTHALIQEGVEFNNLSLVVIDEQHRFGVRQRAGVRSKGLNPDVLVMTATPIPRSLALTIYGDLDVSVIKGVPPGRKEVETRVYSMSRASQVYKEIKKQVGSGRQAYIVCPLVGESEKTDLQAAVELTDYLSSGPLAGCRVELLHGRMRSSEKERVITGFRCGAVDVLVSTTVVEVGIDVPNATLMAVMNAERFGLAQLHQLRGRVGRGPHPALCCLISDARSSEALSRLEAMKSIRDGFELAEKDLELRGPGDLFGLRQWGEVHYRIANPVRDIRALKAAAQEAGRLVESDPRLKDTSGRIVAAEILSRFKELMFLNIG